jgi:hypothetical protein
MALNITADRQFKRRHTTVKPFQRSSCLVTNGVFRWTRNPMNLGIVLVDGCESALVKTRDDGPFATSGSSLKRLSGNLTNFN